MEWLGTVALCAYFHTSRSCSCRIYEMAALRDEGPELYGVTTRCGYAMRLRLRLKGGVKVYLCKYRCVCVG